MYGFAAAQAANSAAPGRSPRPATTAISRSWAATAVSDLQAIAVRAVFDPAAAAWGAGEVSGALEYYG
jgi:hypothetical protein